MQCVLMLWYHGMLVLTPKQCQHVCDQHDGAVTQTLAMSSRTNVPDLQVAVSL
jgi:hypothetical protein